MEFDSLNDEKAQHESHTGQAITGPPAELKK
jgi:hypothetical protein